MSIKVIFCSYDSPDTLGGPFVWLLRLLPAMRERGIECRCLFIQHSGDTGPTRDALLAQGFDCPATNYKHTEDRVRWILERLRENPPDIFVPNLVVAAYFASRWVREAGIPTIGMLRSDDDFYHEIANKFVFGVKKFCLSALVCVSRELEQGIIARKPKGVTVKQIPSGPPTLSVSYRKLSSVLRLAYTGRLVEEQKRISELSRAFCRAVREITGTEAVIYGDGPDRANVEKILATEGAGLPVRLAGRIDSDKIQERLLAMDVIVLLSDYEGLPISVMESMACGCVPVCLRIKSGIPELIEDGVTGLLVDDRGDGFVNAIRRLKNEPGLWQRLSVAARAKIENEYSEKICVEKWVELFEELHKSSRPKRPIVIPKRLHLPKTNPALESVYDRPVLPLWPVRIYKRTRMFLGRIKRRAFGQPIS